MVDPSLPTVLVYGHYDVQPADPLNLWHSGPFEPVIKDGKIYARGACDDKGQMYMHIKALETMAKTNSLPCNVKVMIEGEEEVGSVNLGKFLEDNKERLKADIGFYDKVAELSAAERAAINNAPFDLEEYKKELGVNEVWGEKGYTTLERTGIRPTLE
eukprot:gene20578-20494_t